MRIHSSGSPPDGEDGDEPQDEPDDDPADSGRDDHVGLGHHVVDEGLAGVPDPAAQWPAHGTAASQQHS